MIGIGKLDFKAKIKKKEKMTRKNIFSEIIT